MKISPFRLLAVIVILLAAGLGIAGFLLIGDDEDESGGDGDDVALDTTTTSQAPTTTTSDGGFTNLNTSTTVAGGSTTTTRLATTTTTRPPTTTTTAATTTTTVAGGTTTTTARPGTGICGTGTARVVFTAENLVTTGAESSFTAQAVVMNEITKPIEVETLVAEVSYPDGSTKTVRFSTAGTTIASGASSTFTGERVVNPTQFSSARVSSFAYFTAGQRDRCRVST